MFLEEVLRYVNNRFDCDSSGAPVGSAEGTFSIEGGSLEVDGLLEGQYFWVEGSALNDGLHLYPDSDMSDEEFEGRVVFLRVPRILVDLADEMEVWNAEYADMVDSPLQSESFGGYSYTKATGGQSGNVSPAAAWQLHFGARLRPYRKLSRDWV